MVGKPEPIQKQAFGKRQVMCTGLVVANPQVVQSRHQEISTGKSAYRKLEALPTPKTDAWRMTNYSETEGTAIPGVDLFLTRRKSS